MPSGTANSWEMCIYAWREYLSHPWDPITQGYSVTRAANRVN
jgi:hypothetical protein